MLKLLLSLVQVDQLLSPPFAVLFHKFFPGFTFIVCENIQFCFFCSEYLCNASVFVSPADFFLSAAF